MEKRYRLTVEFSSRINEEVMGIGDIETMEKTRRILELLVKEERVLLELYKLKLFNEYIVYFENPGEISRSMGVRDTSDIVKPLVGNLPAGEGAYIVQLYNSIEPVDREEFENLERKKVLLENQFGPLRVVRVAFVEIKD